MNEKKITDDNEFSELKKLLKEIPKVDAPDNFELNLMTKIRNNNFELKSEKKKNIFSWALTPALSFAASVFIIIFIFTGENDLKDNSWQMTPQLIEDSVAQFQTDLPKATNNETNSLAKVDEQISNKTEKEELSANNFSLKKFPFQKEGSINLDEVLQSEQNLNSNGGAAKLASSFNNIPYSFDGFFLREIKKVLRNDSLEIKSDSTKKDKN